MSPMRPCLLLCCLLPAVVAAGPVQVRLIAAGADDQHVDPQLADIADFLKQNLAFSRYELLAKQTIEPLPAKHKIHLPRKLQVHCSGEPGNLKVELHHGDEGKLLLRTTLQIEPGQPLVIGGTRDARDHLILVFLTE